MKQIGLDNLPQFWVLHSGRRTRPDTPEEVDALARRAREYLEAVVAGLRAVLKT